MSKYSDHSTVGGQVLAHRFRMMTQNWRIILTVAKFSWLLFFLACLLWRWKSTEIWNYFCCLKASYRAGMTGLPHSFFSTSFMYGSRELKEISDFLIARSDAVIAFKAEFERSLLLNLKLSTIFAALVVIAAVCINRRLGKSLTEDKELVSGHHCVDAKTLRKNIKDKSDITLADIAYPRGSETRHTLITGTTGAGKTNVMIELIDQIEAKNEKMIIVDTVGTFMSYYKEGRDIILNPLDSRSAGWSFLRECDSSAVGEILMKSVAACLIDCGEAADKFWEEAARTVFVETAKKAVREGKTTAEFLEILLKIPMKEIQNYLQGTYGHSLMDIRADKMAISVRATLITAVSVFDILKDSGEQNFSIGNWVRSPGGGILFLSCTPAQRAAVIPLITAWLAIAAESLLQITPTERRTWFLIDELHNLKKLPRLDISLAEVRKFGGCFVMGTQMISQLNSIYGHETAKTLAGLCGTKVVMRIPEPITAKYMSDFLGEKEEAVTTEAISYGANTVRDGVNISRHNTKKPGVPPAEIMDLKTGEAFIKFAGVDLTAGVQFKLHDRREKEAKAFKDQCAQTPAAPKIISLQEYLRRHPAAETDLKFCKIPLNDTLTSKPIYFFDEGTAMIGKFLEDARALNKRVVLFEDGSKYCDAFFEQGKDILLNPKRGGCAWDMLAEFGGDYLRLVKVLIDLSDISDDDRSIAEDYLLTAFSNLDRIVTEITTAAVFDKLLFRSFASILADFTGKFGINDKNTLERYFRIRNYLSLRFVCLNPGNAGNPEISLRKYAEDFQNEYVLFVSCFRDSGMKDLLRLIVESETTGIIRIFAAQTPLPKFSSCIVDASENGGFFDRDGTIVASISEISKRKLKIFDDVSVPEHVTHLVGIRGTNEILLVA